MFGVLGTAQSGVLGTAQKKFCGSLRSLTGIAPAARGGKRMEDGFDQCRYVRSEETFATSKPVARPVMLERNLQKTRFEQ